MGRLDPSQEDRWWKSRIEKEEVQYGVKNQESEPAKPARRGVSFLNTLGQPQVISAPTEGQRPVASLSGPSPAASGHAANKAEHDKQDDTRSLASHASRASAAPPSVGAGPQAPSAASVPASQQAKQSQAGSTSQSAVLMKRLEGLEEALASERVKRLQAEEEMRQIMALQLQHRQQARKAVR